MAHWGFLGSAYADGATPFHLVDLVKCRHQQNGALREAVTWSVDLSQLSLSKRQDFAGVIAEESRLGSHKH